MFVIDSNILISEILIDYEKDDRTIQYREFYQQIALPKRIIPDFILNEFETYMIKVVPSRYKAIMNEEKKRGIRSSTIGYMELLIRNATLISPSILAIKNAYSFYKRFENSHYISFTDSLLLATAQTHGYTIISKDERLTERAKGLNISFYNPQAS